jgi:hypothetical protein
VIGPGPAGREVIGAAIADGPVAGELVGAGRGGAVRGTGRGAPPTGDSGGGIGDAMPPIGAIG